MNQSWFLILMKLMSMSKHNKDSMEELEELTKLEFNWDGEWALPILLSTYANAKNALFSALNILNPPSLIYPCPNWTISFEWETEDIFAYFEIGSTQYAAFYKSKWKETLYFDWSVEEELYHIFKVFSDTFGQINI